MNSVGDGDGEFGWSRKPILLITNELIIRQRSDLPRKNSPCGLTGMLERIRDQALKDRFFLAAKCIKN